MTSAPAVAASSLSSLRESWRSQEVRSLNSNPTRKTRSVLFVVVSMSASKFCSAKHYITRWPGGKWKKRPQWAAVGRSSGGRALAGALISLHFPFWYVINMQLTRPDAGSPLAAWLGSMRMSTQAFSTTQSNVNEQKLNGANSEKTVQKPNADSHKDWSESEWFKTWLKLARKGSKHPADDSRRHGHRR